MSLPQPSRPTPPLIPPQASAPGPGSHPTSAPPPGTFVVRTSQFVRAPIQRVFYVSTSIDLTQQAHGMRAIEGVKHGLIRSGESVGWQGWHFGWRHRHTSLICSWNPPYFFADRMTRGSFRSFEHSHHYREVAGGTMIEDELHFKAPFGILGRIFSRLLLAPYILRLLRRRNESLRRVSEGEEWRLYLKDTDLVEPPHA